MSVLQNLTTHSFTYCKLHYLRYTNLIFQNCSLNLASCINKKLYARSVLDGKSASSKKTLLNYIKVKQGFHEEETVTKLMNVFDFESALKQTYNFVFYSTTPSPVEVVRLLSLYAFGQTPLLHKHFSSKLKNRTLESRILSALPFMSDLELHQSALCIAKLTSVRMPLINFLKKVTLEESVLRLVTVKSLKDAFNCFIIAMELNGQFIKEYGIYDQFLSLCQEYMENASPSQLSLILYFLGMKKGNTGSSSLALSVSKALHPHFNEVSFTDAGLALLGLFRMSLNVEKDSPFMPKVIDKLLERIQTDDMTIHLSHLDTISIISMVKYLRFTSCCNPDLLQSMKHFLLKLDQDSFNASFVCHILAFYATSNFYDKDVYCLLEKKFLRFLQLPGESLRVKDVTRILWALAHSQHSCTKVFLTLVTVEVERMTDTITLQEYPNHVIDGTLALSMLGVFSEKLYTALLQPTILDLLRGQERFRYLSRLLILSQVQHSFHPALSLPLPEVPTEELPKRTIHNECLERPCIRRIAKAIQWLGRRCGTEVFQIQFLVPHINYCSIVLSGLEFSAFRFSEVGSQVKANLQALDGKKVAIDVNDAHTCLLYEGDPKPVGMEVLKRNILRKRGWCVGTLSSAEVEMCREDVVALAALLLQTALSASHISSQAVASAESPT